MLVTLVLLQFWSLVAYSQNDTNSGVIYFTVVANGPPAVGGSNNVTTLHDPTDGPWQAEAEYRLVFPGKEIYNESFSWEGQVTRDGVKVGKWVGEEMHFFITNSTTTGKDFPCRDNFLVLSATETYTFGFEGNFTSTRNISGELQVTLSMSPLTKLVSGEEHAIESFTYYDLPTDFGSDAFTVEGVITCDKSLASIFAYFSIATGDQCGASWDPKSPDHYDITPPAQNSYTFTYERTVLASNRWWFYFPPRFTIDPSCTFKFTTTPTESFPKWAIYTIIGISVGVAVIVIAVVGYCWYKGKETGEREHLFERH